MSRAIEHWMRYRNNPDTWMDRGIIDQIEFVGR